MVCVCKDLLVAPKSRVGEASLVPSCSLHEGGFSSVLILGPHTLCRLAAVCEAIDGMLLDSPKFRNHLFTIGDAC